MLKKMIGYVEKSKMLGEVVAMDFLDETVTLIDIDTDGVEDKKVFPVGEVEILEEAFELGDNIIYNKDILVDALGGYYMVELHKDGDVQLHAIDIKTLEIQRSGKKSAMNKEVASLLEPVAQLYSNYYEVLLAKPQEPTFNVSIVKDYNGEHFTYFYACNNKKDKEIDLIKVLFIGSTLLDEEEHERRTLSYEEYMEAIANGVYKEASPQELQNYVAGMLYGKKSDMADVFEENELLYDLDEDEFLDEDVVECGVNCSCVYECEIVKQEQEARQGVEDTDAVEDAPVSDDSCEKCGQYEDECDCDLWD